MKDDHAPDALPKPSRVRTVELDLPELSPWEALALSYVLDQLDTLLWARHGKEMSELLAAGEDPSQHPDPDDEWTEATNEPVDLNSLGPDDF